MLSKYLSHQIGEHPRDLKKENRIYDRFLTSHNGWEYDCVTSHLQKQKQFANSHPLLLSWPKIIILPKQKGPPCGLPRALVFLCKKDFSIYCLWCQREHLIENFLFLVPSHINVSSLSLGFDHSLNALKKTFHAVHLLILKMHNETRVLVSPPTKGLHEQPKLELQLQKEEGKEMFRGKLPH